VTTFSPAWWLSNPHAQTVWPRIARSRRPVPFTREALTTPDGDELILDHVAGNPAPHFILLHGLEGSSHSISVQGPLSVIARRGFSATTINWRSCARDARDGMKQIRNRRPRFYHSGETTDFDFVAHTLAKRHPDYTFVAFGVSLGGNALLKWLGEHPSQSILSAAATVSVPFDLGAGAKYLERGAGPLYVASFLRSLKRKVSEVVVRFPEMREVVDLERALRAKTFREYDDAATAPLHGFKDADDYYTRSSSLQYLGRITTPTLCVNAEDDPFLPPDVLPRVREAASPCVELRVTQRGGHAGFVAAGRRPWNFTYWADELIVDWLASHA
jgi:predicted alpha/beta-fold hydrolase